MRQQTTDKRSVCYRQFQGGYANFPAIELRALMEGNRRPFFRRSEVRVFRLDGRWLLCTKIAACKLNARLGGQTPPRSLRRRSLCLEPTPRAPFESPHS